jgi:muramoyltetrapeptide carboxypeptidase LdcA involved in peptidoglycan recycling
MNEIEKAKQVLENAGYQVDNLWHIDDVKQNYNCTDEEAMEVLIEALGRDYIMETVFDIISLEAEEIGLTRKED